MLSTNKNFPSFSHIFLPHFLSPQTLPKSPPFPTLFNHSCHDPSLYIPSLHTIMQSFNDKHQENNDKDFQKPPRNKKTKKSGDKYSFFSCCKPDDVIMSSCALTPGRREDDSVSKYVKKMEEKDGVVFPKLVPAGVSSPEKDPGGGRHRKKDKKSITRVLKAVFFETTLAKRIKKRKLIQKLHKSNAKLAAKFERGLKPKKRGYTFSDSCEIGKKFDTKNVITKQSSVYPLKSSYPSSVCSDPQSLSARTFHYNPDNSKLKSNNEEKLKHGRGKYSCNSGLCLILLSLLVLVIWGKVCAILCTSAWLFLVPLWSSGNKSFRFTDNSRKIDPEEDKKKIIMEGLLQRNRNRGR